MKRDLNLMRSILLKIEDFNDDLPIYPDYFFDLSENKNLIDYHLHILVQADFVDAYDITTIGSQYKQYAVLGLTFAGCDYLDSVRDKNIWDTVQNKLSVVGSSATIEVIKALANAIVLHKLGL